MEQTYKIIGIQSGNGYKKLELKQLENLTNEKQGIDALSAIKDFNGLVEKTKKAYTKTRQIDVIRIPEDEYKNKKLELDGLFTITY